MLVKLIKRFHHTTVANVMYELGWRWHNPKRRPHNVERMLEGLSKNDLERIHQRLIDHTLLKFRGASSRSDFLSKTLDTLAECRYDLKQLITPRKKP
jgi:hypothetical protein